MDKEIIGPMETILVLSHPEAGGALAKPALEVLNAALTLQRSSEGAKLFLGLIGENIQAAAESVANCAATKYLGVTGPEFSQPRYATDAAAAEAICKSVRATIVMVPATARWNRVMAGVAQRLGGRIDTHVTAVMVGEGAIAVRRWYYRQRMEAVLVRTPRPWIIGIDPGALPAGEYVRGPAAVEIISVPLSEAAKRTTVVGVRESAASVQTIRPDASLLLVAGAGWTKKQADGQTHLPEAEKIILGFLEASRASLGSSKSLVDLSGEGQAVLPFLSHLNQIGQTGSTPRHPKGLSTCCHGEEPHTVGWRFIGERRAISLDPNCGWARGKADVLYVADAFKVMTTVNALLTAP